jgi:hypothetical protein
LLWPLARSGELYHAPPPGTHKRWISPENPTGDLFGVGLGLLVPFESALFSSPEGRSYNATLSMPYRKGAKVVLVNESKAHALVWYDIDYTETKKHPREVLCFHAACRLSPPVRCACGASRKTSGARVKPSLRPRYA